MVRGGKTSLVRCLKKDVGSEGERRQRKGRERGEGEKRRKERMGR